MTTGTMTSFRLGLVALAVALAAASHIASAEDPATSRAPGDGTPFVDCDGGCPAMVVIPGNPKALLGSPLTETGRLVSEAEHEVAIGAFALGKYEVSVREYTACVTAGACREPSGASPAASTTSRPGMASPTNRFKARLQVTTSPSSASAGTMRRLMPTSSRRRPAALSLAVGGGVGIRRACGLAFGLLVGRRRQAGGRGDGVLPGLRKRTGRQGILARAKPATEPLGPSQYARQCVGMGRGLLLRGLRDGAARRQRAPGEDLPKTESEAKSPEGCGSSGAAPASMNRAR